MLIASHISQCSSILDEKSVFSIISPVLAPAMTVPALAAANLLAVVLMLSQCIATSASFNLSICAASGLQQRDRARS